MTEFGAPEIEPLPLVQVLQIDRDTALVAARSWASPSGAIWKTRCCGGALTPLHHRWRAYH
jgi:hypothetical protein